MPDNVKTALARALQRLLRPLVRIMLREGLTYSSFAAVAQLAFVESAVRDFGNGGGKVSLSSVCALTGLSHSEVLAVIEGRPSFASTGIVDDSNLPARVLHGWHNDRAYVGPYGFPIDLPFVGPGLNFCVLASRHAPGVPPEIILRELVRIGAVAEVGSNVWKPLKQEFIEPSLSAENIRRMAGLVESLLATLENNTRSKRDGTDLFERTMIVDAPLTDGQLRELQAYLKVVGGQFLQRVDAFAAVELQEKLTPSVGEVANIKAGLQCFLYVEPSDEADQLRDFIDLDQPVKLN